MSPFLAYVRQAANPDTAPKITDFANTSHRTRDLGPKQLAWLQQNSPAFRKAQADVKQADENARRVMAMAGLAVSNLSI